MVNPIGFVLLTLANWPVLAGCLSEAQLNHLNQQETAYLLGQIPPAFAHAVEDKTVRLDTQISKDEPCTASLTITLPERDLADAQRILDADIAKKIMLTGQGYSLPESTQMRASYLVALDKAGPAEKEKLQTKPLGKLRASVELMYAMLTQARAEVKPGQQNSQPWQADYKAQRIAQCQQTLAADSRNGACTCQASGLEALVTQRQSDYLHYIKSNPYAKATGNDKTYNGMLEKLNDDCGLKIKPLVTKLSN